VSADNVMLAGINTIEPLLFLFITVHCQRERSNVGYRADVHRRGLFKIMRLGLTKESYK
jgi:hypothetical protein